MLKLGENIKRLRQEKDLTQEQLADIFGVSPQAVSRWENSATYPDITLLPTIAVYFEVTLDDLMGMEEIRDEKRFDEIIKTHIENSSNGLVEENIALMRAELKNYPNNYYLLGNLANDLAMCNTRDGREITKEEEHANWREAIAISERILTSCCSDDDIRYGISSLICYLYDRVGENEKAIEYAKKLPDAWASKTVVLGNLYKGEKKKEHLQWTIMETAAIMHYALQDLADLNYEDESISTSERIEILKKGLQIYDIIFDKGDYLFYSIDVSKFNRYIAAMEMLRGDHEAAICHLEEAAKYAIMMDTLPEKERHTSLLINKLEHDMLDTSKNYTCSNCSELLQKMQWDRYDAIRGDDRFKAIIDKISKYA